MARDLADNEEADVHLSYAQVPAQRAKGLTIKSHEFFAFCSHCKSVRRVSESIEYTTIWFWFLHKTRALTSGFLGPTKGGLQKQKEKLFLYCSR